MATNSAKQRASREQPGASTAPPASPVSAEERRTMISEAAYYLSQQRIAAGERADDVADWLQAEQSIEQRVPPTAPVHQHGTSVDV